MKTVLRGGCLCGAVRYECTGDPGNASYCHCDDIWTKRAVPWAYIDEKLPCFPEGRPPGKE
jgi:hypothetical protein